MGEKNENQKQITGHLIAAQIPFLVHRLNKQHYTSIAK